MKRTSSKRTVTPATGRESVRGASYSASRGLPALWSPSSRQRSEPRSIAYTESRTRSGSHFLDEMIDLAVEDLASDWLDHPEYVELDDAISGLDVDSLRQVYPLIPRSASDAAHQEVLSRFRRLTGYDPDSGAR